MVNTWTASLATFCCGSLLCYCLVAANGRRARERTNTTKIVATLQYNAALPTSPPAHSTIRLGSSPAGDVDKSPAGAIRFRSLCGCKPRPGTDGAHSSAPMTLAATRIGQPARSALLCHVGSACATACQHYFCRLMCEGTRAGTWNRRFT
jgi:hypothetical protein